MDAMKRMQAMFYRYLYLHKRSVSRGLELFFWPVMELLVWGFLTLYIRKVGGGDLSQIIVYLISAVIFWDVLYRSQQGITISFIEDIWTQNILNLLISPLRIWEWLVATFVYGLVKTLTITVLLTLLAIALYHFNMIETIGFSLIPMAINILLFGWALGIFTSGLLIRWGHSVEALIWGVPFLVQPLSAIFYPVSTLPKLLQPIAMVLPSTYVFEGMRAIVAGGSYEVGSFLMSLVLNGIYFVIACLSFLAMYRASMVAGKLGRLGTD